ncbi:aminotransferase class IV [Chlorogloeopsis sp. ULAP01]|uniref:aminotransferase class IV n=1 Tax=Chlorogloeopsis sp. ULAP01 TaxID=3056483 RepID=UPI0025AADC45|nr:aminotransferase class IV [Chlorogloeopsis sp. ULAP01]MDM9382556.1 aminotransferase class IV [Chlorogloeopsis sp. ULAP01]
MLFEATQIAWYNGRLVEREQAAPSIASHSLHLGIGVFDGMMAYWNRDRYYVHQIDAHLERFRIGSQKMDLGFPWSCHQLKLGIEELLSQLPPADYYIRPIVYRSCPQINVTGSDRMAVDVAIFGVIAPRDLDTPLSCHISPYERVSSLAIPVTWKICGSYVNSYLARRAAEKAGFNDGIMLDQKGRITEASAANLFLLNQETIVTPALTPEIFPGITRFTLLDIAKSLGIEVVERDVYPEELENFEGAFLASTLMELKPLERIDWYKYNSSSHPLYRFLLKEFREITHQ